MSLPEELQEIYDEQSQAVKDALAARLEQGAPDPGVPLCCKEDSEGNEVCIAVQSHTECCASCTTKFCKQGMTLEDGSVECND